MLQRRSAVNAPVSGFGGRIALQAAVESGSTGLVEILITAGSDLNAAASPNFGCTALQAACKSNNIELASKLISLGVDVNAAPSPINGRTCLQEAARKGHSELVQFILNSGAEVNAAGAAKYGFTALQAAARAGHLSVVKTLLAADADVHAPATARGYSAISAAVMGNDLEMVQLFLKAAGPHGDAEPLPPIFRASRKGATEIVQCLTRADANINALRTDMPSSGYGYPCTALEAALCSRHYHLFEMLLDASTVFNGQVPGLRAALGAASWEWTYNFGPTERDFA
jgi:ankyrin repeat protein